MPESPVQQKPHSEANNPHQEPRGGDEMGFLEHLELLRWHLIRSLAAIAVFAATAFVAKRIVFHHIILGPSRPDFWTYQMFCRLGRMVGSENLCIEKLDFIIQNRTMTGQFTSHILVSFVAGFIIAFPYVFWEVWRFVAPGLYPNERKMTSGSVFWVTLLFLTGVLFAYYLIVPLSVNFLSGYQVDPSVMNEIDLRSYMGLVVTLVLTGGLMFQLPMAAHVMSKAGIVTPQLMREYRKHSLVASFALAAILTPSDVTSMMLVAIPLVILYEISIWLSKRVYRKKQREINEQQVGMYGHNEKGQK